MDPFFYVRRLFRSAFRNKGLTLINLSGLALGLAAAMFLLVYLRFEFSYDTHFRDADRIYRVLTVGNQEEKENIRPGNLEKLASSLVREIPEVETATRLFVWGKLEFKNKKGEKVTIPTYLVDSTFLHIFNFSAVYGNPLTALNEPGKCVLTRRIAERLFGAGVNPVGKTLVKEDLRNSRSLLSSSVAVLEVAAVIENVPANTHMQFGLLTKLPDFGFGGFEYFTYYKLRAGVDAKQAVKKCDALNTHLIETIRPEWRGKSMSEPLRSIHVFTPSAWDLTPTVNRSNLFFIILVTLFVLGIAVCNFISLAVVQGEGRALEISVRKTHGAGRGKIVALLFGESFLITGIAFVLSLVLYHSFSAYLSERLGFHMPQEESGRMIWGWFILLFLGISLVAGGYPAYYLSRFHPSELIRNSVVRKYRLTVTSVVVQFVVVIFCVASLSVLQKQMDFIETLPLGYEPDNILTARLPVDRLSPVHLQELSQYPGITAVTQGDGVLVGNRSKHVVYRQGQKEEEGTIVHMQAVGSGYLKLYRIPILNGRDFYEDIRTDSANVILSESAAKALKLGEYPIGEKIIFRGSPYTVAGIAGDIYFSSLHKKRENVVYTVSIPYASIVSVRFEPGKYATARESLSEFMKTRFGENPESVQLIGDLIKYQYRQDQITARILTSGTLLSIVLALLGLGALMGFVARQKRKEIGIRRVLGAQVSEIVFDLNRYVVVRILPAVPFGIALSYYVMSRWLTNFAYTVSLDGWLFAWALFLTLVLVVFTLLYQSVRAATANPVDALKNE